MAKVLHSNPIALLKAAGELFETLPCQYAVIGGMAAAFYRDEVRATIDVDIAIALDDQEKALEIAKKSVKKLGFVPGLANIADLSGRPMMNKRQLPIIVVIGRLPDMPKGLGIDVILPSRKWVGKAVERAQYNILSFGEFKLPVITPEDVILSKCIAIKDNPGRDKDFDDIKSIFRSQNCLDINYLQESLRDCKVQIPIRIWEDRDPEVRKWKKQGLS